MNNNSPLGKARLEVEFSRYEGFLQMKKSGFTDSQIAEALKRIEAGLSVPELCQQKIPHPQCLNLGGDYSSRRGWIAIEISVA